MKIFEPQVRLFFKSYLELEKQNEYFLHAVTFCDETNYRAAGHEPLPNVLNEEGLYEVNLLVKKDSNLYESESLTPIVHTISLGVLPFGADDGNIVVNLYLDEEGLIRAKKKKKKLGGTISATSDASSDGRPIV